MRLARNLSLSTMMALVFLCFGCGKASEEVPFSNRVRVNANSIEKVSPMLLDQLYPAVGTVTSGMTAEIASKVTGDILTVKVKEGDAVKEGEVLVELQSRELKARQEAARNSVIEADKVRSQAEAGKELAKAQLDLAEVTYERFKELAERQSVSAQEFDEIKAKYEGAKAAFKQAEEALGSVEAKKKQAEAAVDEAETYYGYTKIRAPFSGIITQKSMDEGDLAIPGSTLLVLEDNQHYQLRAVVDESKTEKIETGEEVEVTLAALGEERMKGKVAEVIPRIDPATRTFQVKIDLPPLSGITSGMYGKAFFPMGKTSLLLVPQSAVIECGQLSGLLMVNEKSQVERRLVKVGKIYGDRIEILSGLNQGESVVVRDLDRVKEGCFVEKEP
jgi:RND family efflux transporter MFP subunit